jgi:ABC-2 type transport system permease protein
MVPHFPLLVLAELRAVFGRASGKGALALAALIPAVALYAMHLAQAQAAEAQVNGLPLSQMLDASWRGVADWALTGRNFFLLPLLLVLSTAATSAGELADNTLREALTRPVSRTSVLLAKLIALAALSASTLVLSFVPAVAGGAALFATDTPIGPVALGYAASFLSDLGLIALTLLAGVLIRNVGGVVVSVILFLLVDKAIGLALKGLGVLGVEGARTAARFLPGTALACWEGWKVEGAETWPLEPFVGLAALFAIGIGGALARFTRMDVP